MPGHISKYCIVVRILLGACLIISGHMLMEKRQHSASVDWGRNRTFRNMAVIFILMDPLPPPPPPLSLCITM